MRFEPFTSSSGDVHQVLHGLGDRAGSVLEIGHHLHEVVLRGVWGQALVLYSLDPGVARHPQD